MRSYEVLFYNGWQDPPAYYLLGGIDGRSPREALKRNLKRVIEDVREEFLIYGEASDERICESLYALRSDGLVPGRELIRQL